MLLNPQSVLSNYSHLNKLTDCHCLCFPNSLATKLGKTYVKKTIEWFLADSQRFIFHVEVNGEVAGYCGGFIPKGIGDGSSSGMLQFGFNEAIKGFITKPWLAFNKEVRAAYPFIFRNIKRKLFNNVNATTIVPKEPEKYVVNPGLVVICVQPKYRGTAVFGMLMNQFDVAVKSYGFSNGFLSVRVDNKKAIKGYKRHGWTILETTYNTHVMQKHME